MFKHRLDNIINFYLGTGKEEKKTNYECPRLVATLSSRSWAEAEKIFHLYEGGNIKGQRKVKEQMGMPDCKKSNWQFLHGLTEAQQLELLSTIVSIFC